MKSYQRFAALQYHLDCGKNERKLEREPLLDKVVHGYASQTGKANCKCSTTAAVRRKS